MWSIFDNEDFSLRTDKNKKERYETRIRKKRTYERMNRSRSFMSSSRKPFGSFSQFDPTYYNTSGSFSAAAQYNALKRSFRKRTRIFKNTLLKLIKIINKFPQIESEDTKEISIDVDLIKKLNKIVEKIDMQNLKTKRKLRKSRSKSTSVPIDGLKRKLSSRRSFASNYLMPFQSSYNIRNSTNVQKRKIIKHNLTFNSTSNTNHLRRIGRRLSNNNFGIMYSKNFKNNYHYYMNFKNKRAKNASYYNDTDDLLVTDFFMHSTLNSSTNKLSSLERKKKNMLSMNSFRSSSNFRKSDSMIPNYLNKNFKSNNFQSLVMPKNYNAYGTYQPMMSSLTHYVNVPRRNIEKRRIFLTKQLKKFTKEEKIRSLLRTASNEDELVKAMNVAKNAGLTFEAKLGEKKLQKLKTEA